MTLCKNKTMQTILKSPEVLRAQVAAFAAEAPTTLLRERSYELLDAETIEQVPQDQLPWEYVARMGRMAASRHAEIAGRVVLQEAYGAYADTVADVLEAKRGFVGSGTFSTVYALPDVDRDLVVRSARSENAQFWNINRAALVDSYVHGAVRNPGIPGLERMVAASYVDGVTVSERVPGQPLHWLDKKAAKTVTQQQADDFVKTIFAARTAGLQLEVHEKNVLYHPEAGFGIVDYQAQRVGGWEPDAVAPLRVTSELGLNLGRLSRIHLRSSVLHDKFTQAVEAVLPDEHREKNLAALGIFDD